jgi:hypothetical protein
MFAKSNETTVAEIVCTVCEKKLASKIDLDQHQKVGLTTGNIFLNYPAGAQ